MIIAPIALAAFLLTPPGAATIHQATTTSVLLTSPGAALVQERSVRFGSGGVTPDQEGDRRGVTVSGAVRLSGDTGGHEAVRGGPPPCWYVPGEAGPETYQSVARDNRLSGGSMAADIAAHAHDTDGRWWDAAGLDSAAGRACYAGMPERVWVKKGDPPPPQHVTAAQLAQVARAALLLVPPRIHVSPSGRGYVGMGVWVWASNEKKTRHVVATVPRLGLSATVTATRTGLTLTPGTPDATLHPATGHCTGLGTPYTGSTTPPCGITYLRASASTPDQAWKMTASFTWTVHWTGNDGTNGPMAPGTYTTTTRIPIGEVQTVTN